jgi:hypothetical protein
MKSNFASRIAQLVFLDHINPSLMFGNAANTMAKE